MLGVICLILAYALFETRNFTPAARQLPLIVGIPVIILAVYALLKEILKKEQVEVAVEESDVVVEQAEPSPLALTPLKAILVLIIFSAIFLLLGFPVGAVVFIFLLVWRVGKEGILKSLMVTAAIVIPLYLFFVVLIKAPIFKGLLF